VIFHLFRLILPPPPFLFPFEYQVVPSLLKVCSPTVETPTLCACLIRFFFFSTCFSFVLRKYGILPLSPDWTKGFAPQNDHRWKKDPASYLILAPTSPFSFIIGAASVFLIFRTINRKLPPKLSVTRSRSRPLLYPDLVLFHVPY